MAVDATVGDRGVCFGSAVPEAVIVSSSGFHGAPVMILDSPGMPELVAYRYPFLPVDTIEVIEPGRRA